MSRYRAAAIHFGLSAVVFVGLAYLVVYVWYPSFFFETDGGWQGMRILIGVDLVLGPLLTLIVFKTGKPGLKFDLSVIATAQIVCLGIGTWIVWTERPVALVYVDGWFYSMNADAYREVGADVPDLSGFQGPSPKWVTVDIPDDFTEQSDLRGKTLDTGKSLRVLSERYAPFARSVLKNDEAYPSARLTDRDREAHGIAAWTERHGGSPADYVFYPFGARYAFAFLGFSAEDHRFIGFLDTPAG